jgi:membrane protein implicated in regulation of membrane protease activity
MEAETMLVVVVVVVVVLLLLEVLLLLMLAVAAAADPLVDSPSWTGWWRMVRSLKVAVLLHCVLNPRSSSTDEDQNAASTPVARTVQGLQRAGLWLQSG